LGDIGGAKLFKNGAMHKFDPRGPKNGVIDQLLKVRLECSRCDRPPTPSSPPPLRLQAYGSDRPI